MNVRIGDAERDESVALLAEHFSKGRLSPAEHEQRRSAAKSATLRGELEVLFEDLPVPHPDLSYGLPATTDPEPSTVVRKQNTPLSSALAVVGVLLLFLGVPGTIVLGFTLGLWWTIAPVVVLMISMWIASDLAAKKPARD
jgi:hypothetical protein